MRGERAVKGVGGKAGLKNGSAGKAGKQRLQRGTMVAGVDATGRGV